jgi:transcriptional regulator with XRE-family HTH domain
MKHGLQPLSKDWDGCSRQTETEIVKEMLKAKVEIVPLSRKNRRAQRGFDFGNIRVLRNLKGMTLPELAKAAGIAKGYLSQIENGKQNNPSLKNLSKLADILNVNLSVLIGEKMLPLCESNIAVQDLESSSLTALALIRAALEQLPDKQGGTRCKMDMAQRVLSQSLQRLEYAKLRLIIK